MSEIDTKHLQRRFLRALSTVGLVCAFSHLAIAADDEFVFSEDRFSVRAEVRGMPLGDVLRRLLDNAPADIQLWDPTLGKQPITGSFDGPIADVVRQVLRGTNFMVAYSGNGRVARVIVLGKSGQTVSVAPGVTLVPAGPFPPASPPAQQTVRPAMPAHVPSPPRRSHDM